MKRPLLTLLFLCACRQETEATCADWARCFDECRFDEIINGDQGVYGYGWQGFPGGCGTDCRQELDYETVFAQITPPSLFDDDPDGSAAEHKPQDGYPRSAITWGDYVGNNEHLPGARDFTDGERLDALVYATEARRMCAFESQFEF